MHSYPTKNKISMKSEIDSIIESLDVKLATSQNASDVKAELDDIPSKFVKKLDLVADTIFEKEENKL